MFDRLTESVGKKKCAAHSKRDGTPCKNAPVTGTNVCRMHGGSAPQVKRKARQRLDEAADRMASQLLKIADGAESEAVKLAAVKDALDRAGLKAPDKVDVEVGVRPFEELAGKVLGIAPMTREESRARRGLSSPPALDAGDDRSSPGDGQSSYTSVPSDDQIVDAEIVDDDGGETAESAAEQGSARPAGMRTDDGGGNRPGHGLMTLEEAQALANDANLRAGVYGRRRR